MIVYIFQLTKGGMLFVLDALTGEPLFPVEERAVPQSEVISLDRLNVTKSFQIQWIISGML